MTENEIFIECPRCGTHFEEEDLDFLYPANRQKTNWCAACPFCHYNVLAPTLEEAKALFINVE